MTSTTSTPRLKPTQARALVTRDLREENPWPQRLCPVGDGSAQHHQCPVRNADRLAGRVVPPPGGVPVTGVQPPFPVSTPLHGWEGKGHWRVAGIQKDEQRVPHHLATLLVQFADGIP